MDALTKRDEISDEEKSERRRYMYEAQLFFQTAKEALGREFRANFEEADSGVYMFARFRPPEDTEHIVPANANPLETTFVNEDQHVAVVEYDCDVHGVYCTCQTPILSIQPVGSASAVSTRICGACGDFRCNCENRRSKFRLTFTQPLRSISLDESVVERLRRKVTSSCPYMKYSHFEECFYGSQLSKKDIYSDKECILDSEEGETQLRSASVPSASSEPQLFNEQERVYKKIGVKMLNSVLRKMNTCCVCVGGSGTGKSYTLLGTECQDYPYGSDVDRGLIPRFADALFDRLEAAKSKTSVYVTYAHIGNTITDLITGKSLQCSYQAASQTIPVHSLTDLGTLVRGKSDFLDVLRRGYAGKQALLTPRRVRPVSRRPEWSVAGLGARTPAPPVPPTAGAPIPALPQLSTVVLVVRVLFPACGGNQYHRSVLATFVELAPPERSPSLAASAHAYLPKSGTPDVTTAYSTPATPLESPRASSLQKAQNLSQLNIRNLLRTKCTMGQVVQWNDDKLSMFLRDTLEPDCHICLVMTGSCTASQLNETLNDLEFCVSIAKARRRAIQLKASGPPVSLKDIQDGIASPPRKATSQKTTPAKTPRTPTSISRTPIKQQLLRKDSTEERIVSCALCDKFHAEAAELKGDKKDLVCKTSELYSKITELERELRIRHKELMETKELSKQQSEKAGMYFTQLLEFQHRPRIYLRLRHLTEEEMLVDPIPIALAADRYTLTVKDPEDESGRFNQQFARVFPYSASQSQVFESLCWTISTVLSGYNAFVIGEGPVGSGRTYTVHGTEAVPGLYPRLLNAIWSELNTSEFSYGSASLQVASAAFVNGGWIDYISGVPVASVSVESLARPPGAGQAEIEFKGLEFACANSEKECTQLYRSCLARFEREQQRKVREDVPYELWSPLRAGFCFIVKVMKASVVSNIRTTSHLVLSEMLPLDSGIVKTEEEIDSVKIEPRLSFSAFAKSCQQCCSTAMVVTLSAFGPSLPNTRALLKALQGENTQTGSPRAPPPVVQSLPLQDIASPVREPPPSTPEQANQTKKKAVLRDLLKKIYDGAPVDLAAAAEIAHTQSPAQARLSSPMAIPPIVAQSTPSSPVPDVITGTKKAAEMLAFGRSPRAEPTEAAEGGESSAGKKPASSRLKRTWQA